MIKNERRGRKKAPPETEEQKKERKIRLLKYQKEYYEKNRDRILKKTKEYQNDRRAQIRIYNMNYYFRRGGASAARAAKNKEKHTFYPWDKKKMTASIINKQITLSLN